jgi:hypothetical protein
MLLPKIMFPFLFVLWHISSVLAKQQSCSAKDIPYPTLFGAKILALSVSERQNYSYAPLNITGLNFCNVNITYTHPGYNDTIHVQVWLPLKGWNQRFQGTGGSGFVTGVFDQALAPAVAQGYSAVSTDGGHELNVTSAAAWALVSPGNVDWNLLQDFASTALNDMTVLGKAVTKSYYGTAPKYSYWNGCSTGGRQGLMMAQRFPDAYDGILAAAPAINWPSFIVAEYWGQFMMNQLGVYPPQCEFDAITTAAVSACDALDGLVDGIIASPEKCHFNPHILVGKSFNCSGVNATYTPAAATIASAAWGGAHTVNGTSLWYGLNRGAPFSGLLNTTCSNLTAGCGPTPFTISSDWIRLWIEKNPNFSITSMSFADYVAIFHQSNNEYASIIGTADPDLSAFAANGGKMITWHGLADQLIFPSGTADYYNRVLAGDPAAHDYYRFFEAPGVEHCGGGIGPVPTMAFESVVSWVETGVAPATLNGTSAPDVNGTVKVQPLCPYPLVSAYQGGDPAVVSSFACAAAFK